MMYLRFWEKGTRFSIHTFSDESESIMEFQAVFHELIDDMNFYAESGELYHYLRQMTEMPRLRVEFFRGATMFTFIGRIKRITYEKGFYLTHIEQTSPIEETSRRKDPRDEMKIGVNLYGLEERQVHEGPFVPHGEPEFSSFTLNISAGGLCLVSDRPLISKYEPYFLAEFSLGQKDRFLLPCKLVRKSNCPQTVLYKYDYGLAFLFDALPSEKQRLKMAIFREKLNIVGPRLL